MSTRVLTQDEKDFAAACDMSEEAYLGTLLESEMQPGTYAFQIASCKVNVAVRDNMMKGSIQANLRLIPLDSNGNPVKRFGGVFKNMTVPVANAEYVPNSVTISVGAADIKALATVGNISMAKVMKEFKAFGCPAELLNKTIKGVYSLRPDKNDATRFYPEVKFSKGDVKVLTPLKPDGGGSSAVAQAPRVDGESPF